MERVSFHLPGIKNFFVASIFFGKIEHPSVTVYSGSVKYS
jgi:hypothetical protein